jgi:hypothetical protein
MTVRLQEEAAKWGITVGSYYTSTGLWKSLVDIGTEQRTHTDWKRTTQSYS